jgi:hypothetical protein
VLAQLPPIYARSCPLLVLNIRSVSNVVASSLPLETENRKAHKFYC